jgi:hypothetical protein
VKLYSPCETKTTTPPRGERGDPEQGRAPAQTIRPGPQLVIAMEEQVSAVVEGADPMMVDACGEATTNSEELPRPSPLTTLDETKATEPSPPPPEPRNQYKREKTEPAQDPRPPPPAAVSAPTVLQMQQQQRGRPPTCTPAATHRSKRSCTTAEAREKHVQTAADGPAVFTEGKRAPVTGGPSAVATPYTTTKPPRSHDKKRARREQPSGGGGGSARGLSPPSQRGQFTQREDCVFANKEGRVYYKFVGDKARSKVLSTSGARGGIDERDRTPHMRRPCSSIAYVGGGKEVPISIRFEGGTVLAAVLMRVERT